MKRIFLVLFCLVLAACGESNPLLGNWEGSVDIGNSMLKQGLQAMGVGTDVRVQFTEKEMIVTRGGQETRQAVRYRVENNKVYITEDTGKTEKKETWELIPMKDDTIELSFLPGVTATLRRAK